MNALRRWHRELAQGKRPTTQYDALWAAACEEQSALEAPTDSIRKFHVERATRELAAYPTPDDLQPIW